MDQLSLPIPNDLIETLARRVAEIVLAEMEDDLRPSQARWLRAKDAAQYLGWTRSALYSRVHRRSIPHYKVQGMLRFRRDELDRWLAEHRVEPHSHRDCDEPPVRRRRLEASSRDQTTRGGGNRVGQLAQKRARKKRERALPPPLGANREQKDRWARELEITRGELEEMSPQEFEKAWETRNERLEAAGVFEHLDELEEKYGQDIWSMLPSQLIEAVSTLRA
jgi:excisionase family DNA binding protein